MDISTRPVIEDRMFDQFRDIRKKVWFEATLGKTENQTKLRDQIVELSNKAKLDGGAPTTPKCAISCGRKL